MADETQKNTTTAVPPKSAKKDPKTDPTFFPQVFWATALLSAILLVAAAAIAVFNRWRKRQASRTGENYDQLASYRALYERGELSQEEFDKIRARLVVELKHKGPATPPPPKPTRPVSPVEPPPTDNRSMDQP